MYYYSQQHVFQMVTKLTSRVCSCEASSYFCWHTSGRYTTSPFALPHVRVGVGVPTTMALKTANLPKIGPNKDFITTDGKMRLNSLSQNIHDCYSVVMMDRKGLTLLNSQSDGFAGEIWSCHSLRKILLKLRYHDTGHFGLLLDA